MFEIRSILLPVDFSERSLGAAQYAKALACRFRAELHVVHVVDLRAYGIFGLGNDCSAASEFAAGYQKEARRELDGFLAGAPRNLKIRNTLLYGEPAREIVQYAESEKTDLIVMATHGQGPFRRFLLGSVTAKVLHDANCPIWTGVHMDNAQAIESSSFRKIVCALNPWDGDYRALAWAWDFAQVVGGEVKIVHALPPIYGVDSPHFGGAMKEMAAQSAEAEIRKAQETLGSDAEVEIVAGKAHQAVSAAAEDWNADLTVIGRGVASGILGRLRSRSYGIIRESPCPVVSV